MRVFNLITSWVLWAFCALFTLLLSILRVWGRPPVQDKPLKTSGEYFNCMFWGALVMFVGLAVFLYFVRQIVWFSRGRNAAFGYWLVAILFYLAIMCVPLVGFAPYFLGHPGGLQWTSVACVLILLGIGFPKLPALANAETPQAQASKVSMPRLIGMAVSGVAAFVTPFVMPYILSRIPTEKQLNQASPKVEASARIPEISFSPPVPATWTVSGHQSTTNEYGVPCIGVGLVDRDKRRLFVVSIMGRKIPETDKKEYWDNWAPTNRIELKSLYGKNVVEDGFQFRQVGERNMAELVAHSSTPNGELNFVLRGWIENGYAINCETIGKGIAVTNDAEISDLIGRIKLQ